MASRPWSEQEILEGCLSQDGAAAAALVDRYQLLLLRVVVRLVGRWPVAEEIVQETFFRAFRDIDRIDPRRGMQGWLLSVALNLAHDYGARGARAEVSAPVDDALPPLFGQRELNPSEQAIARERQRAIDSALRQLAPKLREVVVLRYIEGLSFPEISKALGVPHVAVRMRAVRARAMLRGMLAEWMQ